MLTLTSEDSIVLNQIVDDLTGFDQDQIRQKIKEGFHLYASEEMIAKFPSRSDFFESTVPHLIKNLPYAGRTSEEAFALVEGRKYLCRLIRELGVSVSDVEDIAQEITRKFWMARWAERYNPLISSWRNFVSCPIRNYLHSYYSRRGKKILNISFSLDQRASTCSGQGNSGDISQYVYEIDPCSDPEKVLLTEELIHEWEDFLNAQGSLKSLTYLGFRKLATLSPPGIPEIPTDCELEVGYFNSGAATSRITTHALYERGLFYKVPNHLLVDYIAMDFRSGLNLVDPETMDFVSQKFYWNPVYRGESGKQIPKHLCTVLPPGHHEYPLDQETEFVYLGGGLEMSRIALPGWSPRELTISNDHLVSYISINEITGESLLDPETQEFLTQNYFINPEYLNFQSGYKIERKLLDIYKHLRDGDQLDEIARIFKVSASSVPAWVKKIEALFRDFWLISDRIPTPLKLLAVHSYQCPGCRKLAHRWRESCTSCGTDMTGEMAQIRLSTYPWSRVYNRRETRDRIESNKRVPITVQHCSL